MNKQVGFVGWRGMVGSVLLERLHKMNDFGKFNATFFSTSQAGQLAPVVKNGEMLLQDAYDVSILSNMEIIIACQGSDYSQSVLPKLRGDGWKGIWIDAASHYRMDPESMIVLDPINGNEIAQALKSGIKNYIGGNCTVSLMMLAIHGLLKANLVEWVSVMSYQAVSGGGAQAMQELLDQHGLLSQSSNKKTPLDAAKLMREVMKGHDFPSENFGSAIAYNVLPFIDERLENGQSKEEWKAQAELNKILNYSTVGIPVDGICVRVPVLRAHSQALTIQLKKELPLAEIERLIQSANPWVRFVENEVEATKTHLTPVAVAETLEIAVGRIKKTTLSNKHIQLFTVGDQLLWGAAEPLRRMLNICISEFEGVNFIST